MSRVAHNHSPGGQAADVLQVTLHSGTPADERMAAHFAAQAAPSQEQTFPDGSIAVTVNVPEGTEQAGLQAYQSRASVQSAMPVVISPPVCPTPPLSVIVTPFPGSARVPPAGSVNFVLPYTPRPALPGAPPHLLVSSRSDQPVIVSYDGQTLTIVAPHGFTVQILSGCVADGVGANRASCPRAPDSQAALGSPSAGVMYTTVALSSDGAGTEAVSVFTGCNNVTLTWPTGTSLTDVAGTVEPLNTLLAIWRFDNAAQRFIGYSPLPNAPNDLTAAGRLDTVFICVTAPARITRPALS